MRLTGIAILLIAGVLMTANTAVLAQAGDSAGADSASSMGIYNPPRVITPDYEPGSVGAGQGDAGPGPQGSPSRPGKGTGDAKCPECQGSGPSRVGAGGEFSTGYLFADFDAVNRQVARMGIPRLSEDVFVVGGRGYARLGHLIIGGAGYAGSSESGGIPDCCARSTRLEIGYGGVILGVAAARPRFEILAGMLLGGGSVEIVRERNSRNVSGWDEAWDDFYKNGPDSVATDELNITSKVTGEFIALEPFVGVKYRLLPFMAVDLSGTYLRAEIGRGEWKLDGVAIPDSPKSDIGGWSLRLGLFFGM
jgi:hypothetical protein